MEGAGFKYEDYFAGIGRTPYRVPSIDAALDLFREDRAAANDGERSGAPGQQRQQQGRVFDNGYAVRRPRPRLSLAELHAFTLRYIKSFPFGLVCGGALSLRSRV